MRWMTAGESHGPALVAILEGLPAGVSLTSDHIASALARRRLGHGRGARMNFENDVLEVIGGLRHGQTLGSPLALRIGNAEWARWATVMAPDPVAAEALRRDPGAGDARELARNKPLTRPRPGHADLAGMTKYGFTDARNVLERASARETAARVALGAAAGAYLHQVAGVTMLAHVVAIGSVTSDAAPRPADRARLEADPVRCADPGASAAMVAAIDEARSTGETLGGVVEVMAYKVPVGLGSHVAWDRRLDARLAAGLMSIPGVKGVEIGDGFAQAGRPGSVGHDEVEAVPGGLQRSTNRAGGLEGGISNGSPLRLRAAVKPISTVPRGTRSVDLATGEPARADHQRSDTCAVVPAAVVAEAMVSLVLAEALAEKVGGDSVAEARRNLNGYLEQVPPTMRLVP